MTTDTHKQIRIGSCPDSFGVSEITLDEAWIPEPQEMLDWLTSLGYEGSELGPPGYLGDGPTVRRRLDERRLDLIGSFLPQHFSRTHLVEDDRAWLRSTLELLRAATPDGSTPFAILSDHFDEPIRMAYAGRAARYPETWLSQDRFETLVANLHRAAEICADAGFRPVVHPHAGTYIETADEIDRLMNRLDPAMIGLCLDTGHFVYGGADPVVAVEDYGKLIRHVHLKDCRKSVVDAAAAEELDLDAAILRGAFVDLGTGDAKIAAVVDALVRQGYDGWAVVEQDQFLTARDTPASVVAAQRRNMEFLSGLGLGPARPARLEA
jgi:inosose dehydratase